MIRPVPTLRSALVLGLAAVLWWLSPVMASERPPVRIAVIVDDLGNQWRNGLAAIDIPFIQTVAIMPGRPYSRRLAEASKQAGKTVIVHAPMANQSDFPLGPLGLDRNEGRARLLSNLGEGLDDVPYAEGLSNHMGSRLTRDEEAMSWIMAELNARDLFFIDSLTVSDSKAWQTAERMGVPWHRRQVFLDHKPTRRFMAGQWRQALDIARKRGAVTVICHPYPETLAFFASLDPADYPDVEWVSVKALLSHPEPRPIPTWRPDGRPRES